MFINRKKYHYVYNITFITTGVEYIGSRSTNVHPTIDLPKYQSSSTDITFKKMQKIHPEQFKYEVLEEFDTREEADKWEGFLLRFHNVSNNSQYINRIESSLSGTYNNVVKSTYKCISKDVDKVLEISKIISENTLAYTSKYFELSQGIIKDICKNNNIDIPSGPRKKIKNIIIKKTKVDKVPKDMLKNPERNIYSITDTFDVSYGTIYSRIKKYNLQEYLIGSK